MKTMIKKGERVKINHVKGNIMNSVPSLIDHSFNDSPEGSVSDRVFNYFLFLSLGAPIKHNHWLLFIVTLAQVLNTSILII